MADVFVINKVDTADADNVILVRENLRQMNPTAIHDRRRFPALRG
jgi:predicted GTPase